MTILRWPISFAARKGWVQIPLAGDAEGGPVASADPAGPEEGSEKTRTKCLRASGTGRNHSSTGILGRADYK